MFNKSSLVARLLYRGDEIAFEQGALVIRSASGEDVPSSWLRENQVQITKELVTMLGIDLVRCIGYSTGCYGIKHCPGVSLQFEWIVSGGDAYVVFNADLKRAKSTKAGAKGAPLPKGHFRVGGRSKFVKFWARIGLQMPKRLSSFHDYMGNLKKLIFTGMIKEGEKLDKDSIKPFSISADEVSSRFKELTDNTRTTSRQSTDNIRTNDPDKQTHESPSAQVSGMFSTTGDSNYGTRSTGSTDTGSDIISYKEGKKHPSEQSIEEWLEDYDGV